MKDDKDLYNKDAIDDLDAVSSDILSDDRYVEMALEEMDDFETIVSEPTMSKQNHIVDGYTPISKHILDSNDFYKISDEFNMRDLVGLTRHEAEKILNINNKFKLRDLVNRGYIRYFEYDGTKRYYTSDVYRLVNYKPYKINVVYVRSWHRSLVKSKKNMLRQLEEILNWTKENNIPIKRIYRDFSVGIDFRKKNRPGLYELLYDVTRRRVDKVYVYSPNALATIGYQLISYVFSLFGTEVRFINTKTLSRYDTYSVIGEIHTIHKIYNGLAINSHYNKKVVDLSRLDYKIFNRFENK